MTRSLFAVLSALLWLTACHSPPSDCNDLPDDQAVGNAGCLLLSDDRLLMVQQRTGRWSTPGGTAEPGERAVCTAQRETREETGLQVNAIRLLRVLDNGFHVYLCTAPQLSSEQDFQPMDQLEIQAVQWQSREQRQALHWRYPWQRDVYENLLQEIASPE